MSVPGPGDGGNSGRTGDATNLDGDAAASVEQAGSAHEQEKTEVRHYRLARVRTSSRKSLRESLPAYSHERKQEKFSLAKLCY